MCGRYVLKKEDLEALVRQFGLRSLEEFHSRYNIAPTSIVPLIRRAPASAADAAGGSDQANELAAVRWGLIPAWTKPDGPPRPLVNVRAETLVTRFRGALKSRRCVLPASGFFEWQQVGPRKQPWFFGAKDGGVFGLAGIWDTWRSPDGATVFETCAILTTTPNSVLQPVHDRMPVMLTPEQCVEWVETDGSDPKPLERLLASAPAERMTAFKVGPAVSSVRNDGPECIAEAVDEPPPAEPQLTLGI